MKPCILCNTPTTGSVGAAGIRWSRICQPCKDQEDAALNNRLAYESKALEVVLSRLGGGS